MFKILWISVVGLCFTGSAMNAATISGILVRAEFTGSELKSVRTVLATPYPESGDVSSVRFVEYHLTFEDADIFIREGDVELIDPETPSSRVTGSTDLTTYGRRLLAVTCVDQGVYIVGVLVGRPPSENPNTNVGPQLCVSVRAPNIQARDRATLRLLSVLKLRLAKERECIPVKGTQLEAGVVKLIGVSAR